MKNKELKTIVLPISLSCLLVFGLIFSLGSTSRISPLDRGSYIKIESVSATDYHDKKNVRLGGCKPKDNWICTTSDCNCN